MGKRTIIEYYDDITGEMSDDIETTTLVFEGVEYEIDLNQKNFNKLREFMDPYINAGRKVGGKLRARRVSTGSGSGTGSRPQVKRYLTEIAAPQGADTKTKMIRSWYEQQSQEFKNQFRKPLKSQGRIPRDIEAAYDEAHGITNGHRPDLELVSG